MLLFPVFFTANSAFADQKLHWYDSNSPVLQKVYKDIGLGDSDVGLVKVALDIALELSQNGVKGSPEAHRFFEDKLRNNSLRGMARIYREAIELDQALSPESLEYEQGVLKSFRSIWKGIIKADQKTPERISAEEASKWLTDLEMQVKQEGAEYSQEQMDALIDHAFMIAYKGQLSKVEREARNKFLRRYGFTAIVTIGVPFVLTYMLLNQPWLKGGYRTALGILETLNLVITPAVVLYKYNRERNIQEFKRRARRLEGFLSALPEGIQQSCRLILGA